jgi:hypothetical protein
MVKVRIVAQKSPKGANIYVVNVNDVITKPKEMIVYADYYMVSDGNHLTFINLDDNGENYVLTIEASYWKSVYQYENMDKKFQCVRFQTLQEHLEEIELIEMETQIEAEKIIKEKEELEKRLSEIKTDELKESIKE